MSTGDDKLKYLINNGYKEIKPTLLGFLHTDDNFYFNYTIKQTFDFYKLIIDCEIFYNDVIKKLKNYYNKLPEDYNASRYYITIYFFILLPKENKNNFTIYLKNVEIFKNQGFNYCALCINEYKINTFFNPNDNPDLNLDFEKFRIKTIEKIINYSSCFPSMHYVLSKIGNLAQGVVLDDNLYSNFSNDYMDAEITEKTDEKNKNSKITNNNIALFYYLLNYYYSHEKNK